MSCNLAYTKIIEDVNCTRVDGTKKVRKTIWERLTWKFWESHKDVPNIIPTVFFIKGENTIICHPSIKKELEESIESLI